MKSFAYPPFPYTNISGHLKPILAIQLKNLVKQKEVRAIGLIDSGSDIILLSKALGEYLEIDFEDCKKDTVKGIDGISNKIWKTYLQIAVDGYPDHSWTAEIGFIDKKLDHVILGGTGFFCEFNVQLEMKWNCFALEPANSSALRLTSATPPAPSPPGDTP